MFRPNPAVVACVGVAAIPGSVLGLTISSGHDPATRVAACLGGILFLLLFVVIALGLVSDGRARRGGPTVSPPSFAGYSPVPTAELADPEVTVDVEVADVPLPIGAGS